MRSIRLHAPRDLRLEDEPVPLAGADETLVRVTAVGVCGSDLHWLADGVIGDVRLSRPVVPGHEIAGVVHDGPLAGTAVSVDPAIPCGNCAICIGGDRNLCPTVGFAGNGTVDGGLRELMAWPTHLLHPLPPGLSTTDGAILEPLGVAIHALDLGHVRAASNIAVIGCGPIGLLLLQTALTSGATWAVAVDPLPHRRAEASARGAALALSPTEAKERYGDPQVDVAFEMAGNDAAVEQAMELVRPGGRVVLGGIPSVDRTSFPASLALRKRLSIVLVRRMKEDVYERGARLVETGRVNLSSLVTGRFPLDRADEAFRSASSRQGLKVVIEPSS